MSTQGRGRVHSRAQDSFVLSSPPTGGSPNSREPAVLRVRRQNCGGSGRALCPARVPSVLWACVCCGLASHAGCPWVAGAILLGAQGAEGTWDPCSRSHPRPSRGSSKA